MKAQPAKFPAKADPTTATDVPLAAAGAPGAADEEIPDELAEDVAPAPEADVAAANAEGMPKYPSIGWPTCLYHPTDAAQAMRVVSTPAEWRAAAQAGYLPPERLPGTIAQRRAILLRG